MFYICHQLTPTVALKQNQYQWQLKGQCHCLPITAGSVTRVGHWDSQKWKQVQSQCLTAKEKAIMASSGVIRQAVWCCHADPRLLVGETAVRTHLLASVNIPVCDRSGDVTTDKEKHVTRRVRGLFNKIACEWLGACGPVTNYHLFSFTPSCN